MWCQRCNGDILRDLLKLQYCLQDLNEPLLFTITFKTADNFSVPTFLADSARVAAFSESVKAELATSVAAQNLTTSMTADRVSVENIKQGSIIFDVEFATAGITDLAVLQGLASAVINRPQTLFSQLFLDSYSVLSVTAVQRKSVAVTANTVPRNTSAIVGGVVGGIGGLLVLIALVVLARKRR